jgi:hypothetical protein
MKDEVLQDEIHKRFTLNWLIQGAAQHASLTFHHLVRDELNGLEPRLLPLYDRFALLGALQYWYGLAALLYGRPSRFWRQAASKRTHPFFAHPLLSKYGGTLAEAGRIRTLQRCKEKGVSCWPVLFSFQVLGVFHRLRALETPHRGRLTQLALQCASRVWGIPAGRLDGELTDRIKPELIISGRTFQAAAMRDSMIGYGGVVRRGDALRVVAHGRVWPVLAHELVKATAELICLHGLNQLSEGMYRRVIDATDRLEFEPWMLQSGGELWRRFLAAIPDGGSLARVLMNLARLPARELEAPLAPVIEGVKEAQDRLAELSRTQQDRRS